MNKIDLEKYHEAHKIILDGSKQASILVLAMIAGRGVWASELSNFQDFKYFYSFSFISVISCILTHLIYGFEYSLFLVSTIQNQIHKAWLYVATSFLVIQIVSLFLSIFFFIFGG